MPGQTILCVAEKPAIAKAVAAHLAGGRFEREDIPGNKFVKNYRFTFNFRQWGHCSVVMTSVLGHLTGFEFDPQYRAWHSCPPVALFEATATVAVTVDHKSIAENIQRQARSATILYIWTDCDREGEYIGHEVRSQAQKGNMRIQVKRAKFSNTERAHVLQAANSPITLDERQINAVAARIELDLRVGASFTRLQSLQLKQLSDKLSCSTISFGPCQFPTMGFVVDRYKRVRSFKAEVFWLIKITHLRDKIKVIFNWQRVHLFDRAAATILFEQCLDARNARVTKMQKKPTSKWKPLPLTTVDLQMQGSRFLRMTSHEIMAVAEKLYQAGWISYPRTETDQFSVEFDLRGLIQKQCQDGNWGNFAQNLMNGAFRTPRSGRHNDQAHPPIHPVNYVATAGLNPNERKVYELVTRRFLACCSEDAEGESTDVEVIWGGERFHAHGLTVLQRNYLDVYVYDNWESSQELPVYTVGESFEPTEANVTEGRTTAPGYLTEPELIGLMDANGIGTDATMADHISKVKDRSYVDTRPRGAGRTSVQEFIPTYLGVALVEGYDNIGLDVSVSKPFLRKEMEQNMKAICEGRRTKSEVVQETLESYREAFARTQSKIDTLKQAIVKYVVNGGTG